MNLITPEIIAKQFIKQHDKYQENNDLAEAVYTVEQVQAITNTIYSDPYTMINFMNNVVNCVFEILRERDNEEEEIIITLMHLQASINSLLISSLTMIISNQLQTTKIPENIDWVEEFKNLDFKMPSIPINK